MAAWNRRFGALALWIVAASALAQSAQAPADPLARLSWLSGCWVSAQDEPGSGEQWLPVAGGTLFGIGRTVRNGKTADFEFMQIRATGDGRLVFIAQPGGRPPTQFVSTTLTEREVVFENPQHDFPQRVIYKLGEAGKLGARIEGLRNGSLKGIDFPLQRVSCDAALPPR